MFYIYIYIYIYICYSMIVIRVWKLKVNDGMFSLEIEKYVKNREMILGSFLQQLLGTSGIWA